MQSKQLELSSWTQDFNYFLDNQPVSASASSRLLAEPQKPKRGAAPAAFACQLLCSALWIANRMLSVSMNVELTQTNLASDQRRATEEGHAIARGQHSSTRDLQRYDPFQYPDTLQQMMTTGGPAASHEHLRSA